MARILLFFYLCVVPVLSQTSMPVIPQLSYFLETTEASSLAFRRFIEDENHIWEKALREEIPYLQFSADGRYFAIARVMSLEYFRVDYIYPANHKGFLAEVTVLVFLYDIELQEVLLKEHFTAYRGEKGDDGDATRSLRLFKLGFEYCMREASAKMVAKMPLQGYVQNVEERIITINLGLNHSISNSSRFEILNENDESLGFAEVISSELKPLECKAYLTTPAEVARHSKVRLVTTAKTPNVSRQEVLDQIIGVKNSAATEIHVQRLNFLNIIPSEIVLSPDESFRFVLEAMDANGKILQSEEFATELEWEYNESLAKLENLKITGLEEGEVSIKVFSRNMPEIFAQARAIILPPIDFTLLDATNEKTLAKNTVISLQPKQKLHLRWQINNMPNHPGITIEWKMEPQIGIFSGDQNDCFFVAGDSLTTTPGKISARIQNLPPTSKRTDIEAAVWVDIVQKLPVDNTVIYIVTGTLALLAIIIWGTRYHKKKSTPVKEAIAVAEKINYDVISIPETANITPPLLPEVTQEPIEVLPTDKISDNNNNKTAPTTNIIPQLIPFHARLEIAQGEDEYRMYLFAKNRLTLGRSDKCDIQLVHLNIEGKLDKDKTAKVSSYHCEIMAKEGNAWLRDLALSENHNSTVINNITVGQEEYALQDKDILRIGDLEILVRMWRDEENRFCCLRLQYLNNPRKIQYTLFQHKIKLGEGDVPIHLGKSVSGSLIWEQENLWLENTGEQEIYLKQHLLSKGNKMIWSNGSTFSVGNIRIELEIK